MKMKTQNNVSEMFDQAVETFDTAMKTGVKIQEEITHWWVDMMNEVDSVQEMQHRMRVLISDAIPISQRNLDEYMKAMDRAYRSSMEMMRKAMEMGQSDSIYDAQSKTQDLWESMLSAMRNNAQSMIQLNSRMMDSWSEFARHDFAGQMAEMAATGAQVGARAAQATAQRASQAGQTAQRAARATGQRGARAAQRAAGATARRQRRTK